MPKIEKEIIVLNKQGLHARPAAMFVQIANKFDSKIVVQKDGESVNGKSIMGILMLGAQQGSKIKITIDGQDCQETMLELENFLKQEDFHG